MGLYPTLDFPVMFNVVSAPSFEMHQKKDLYLSDFMKVCEYRVHLFSYSYVIWKHLALLVLVDEDPGLR